MPDDDPSPEALRLRREQTQTRRSFFIIFGVGAVGVVFAIVYVMTHLPEGTLQSGYGTAVPASANVKQRNAAACQRFGDPCEFSPGKLGSCQERENCSGAGCLFCQSQH